MAYGNKSQTVVETPLASTTQTANGQTAGIPGYGYATTIRAQLNVTAISGTTPNLAVFIEDSIDGTNWYAVGTFTAVTATGPQVINITTPHADLLRIRWAITGTTPSATFAVQWVLNH